MENEIVSQKINIESKIMIVRRQQVMIDRDLAELYGVETKVLNQAVKRNMERFPEQFCFQLTREETDILCSKSQIVTLNVRGNLRGTNIKKLPYVFTEQGVAITIYTDSKTKLSEQDVQKFNEQYPQLTLKHSSKAHDRFLIIDNTILYHIGASLKDLGKKCFAFEALDSAWIKEILKNL